MGKELDKDAYLADKPLHVVLIGTGLDIVLPKASNSKVQDEKTCYKQINGEQYVFIQPEEGFASVEPSISNLSYAISLAYTEDTEPDDFFEMYEQMYEDISDKLPKVNIWCKAISIPTDQPDLMTCQLLVEAQKGTLMIGVFYIHKNKFDEFLAISEFIKPYNGEIPEELHKNAIATENNADISSNIAVDLTDKEQIQSAINRLIDNFYDYEYISFGQEVDGEFKEYECAQALNNSEQTFFKGVGNSSELAFFTAAAEYPELHEIIIDYVELAVSSGATWIDEETPKGLHAAFALALKDEKYISTYIELLKGVDMNHEVYQMDQIAVLAEKWKSYDNGIRLLSVRCMTASGQHGDGNLSFFINNNEDFFEDREKKEKFLRFFMLDVLESNDFRQKLIDDLIEHYIHPVLETVEIDFDEKKLKQIVITMNEHTIPGLDDIV